MILVSGRSAPPVFTMEASWAKDPRLSFAAVGFLARISQRFYRAPEGARLEFADLLTDADDPAIVDQLLDELYAAGYFTDDWGLVDPFEKQWYAEQEARLAALHSGKAARLDPKPKPPPVVYYVRRADGAVKIGQTGDLRNRLKGLMRDYGDVRLLASEEGDRKLERLRHEQFGTLRLPAERPAGGSEWFRYGQTLRAHVTSLGAAG